MITETLTSNRERVVTVKNGWMMLPLTIGLFLLALALLIYSIAAGVKAHDHPIWGLFILALLLLPISIVLLVGLFTLQPNEARVLILFGEYKGTVRKAGFHWGNPFYSNGPGQASAFARASEAERTAGAGKVALNLAVKKPTRQKVSLRARNFNSDKLKVNDKRGNPIEIAAVVVWRVQDTAQATFDVEDFENYVRVQSESALRHLASGYAYDHGEENEVTLRSGVDEVSQALK